MSTTFAFAGDTAARSDDEGSDILEDAEHAWSGNAAEYDEAQAEGEGEFTAGAHAIRVAKGKEFEPTGACDEELVISDEVNGIPTNHANSEAATDEIKKVENLAVPPDQATFMDGLRYHALEPPEHERERKRVLLVDFDEAFFTGDSESLDLRGYSIAQITTKQKGDIPLQFFNLFWTQWVFDLMAKFTNIYVDWKEEYNKPEFVDSKGRRFQKVSGHRWKKTTSAEMKLFVGLIIYMSAHQQSNSQDYWRTDGYWPYHEAAARMPMWRFTQLKMALQFREPVPSGSGLPPWKWVQELADHLRVNFKAAIIMGIFVSLDEVLVRFTGKSFHKIMMKGKPCPIGYYVLAVCEGGYLYDFLFSSPSKKWGFEPSTPPAGFNEKVVVEQELSEVHKKARETNAEGHTPERIRQLDAARLKAAEKVEKMATALAAQAVADAKAVSNGKEPSILRKTTIAVGVCERAQAKVLRLEKPAVVAELVDGM